MANELTGNQVLATTSQNISQIGGTAISTGNGATDAGTQRVTISNDSTGQVKLSAGTAVIGHVVVDSGSVSTTGTKTSAESYGSYTVMTVTNLQSLSSSATAGWQSARIDNQTSVKALDYEIVVKLTTANTSPASDKVAYVYISPAVTTDGGTTWLHADQGTTTLPTGTEGTTTIASPNNLVLAGPPLAYTTAQMTMQGVYLLSNSFGQNMPDGFSIIIVNFTGAALSTSCVVAYKAITRTTA